MSGLDWILIAAVALSVLFAALRGFLYETFSLAGVIAGFVIAAWAYPKFSPWFLQYVKSQPIADFGSFCALFVLTSLLFSLAGEIARSVAKKIGLLPVDRVLGAAFGLVRGVLFGAVLALAIAAFHPQLMAGSLVGRYFLVAARGLAWVSPEELRRQFREGAVAIRKAAADRVAEQPAAGDKKPQGDTKKD